MRKILHFIIIGIISISFFQCSGKKEEENLIQQNIIQGNFETAQSMLMDIILANQDSLSQEKLDSIKFEIERLDRIKYDFSLDSNDVLQKIRHIVPGAKAIDLEKWARENYLESKIIEGERRYFRLAPENIFRVHPELFKMKARQDSIDADRKKTRKYVAFPLNLHINRIIKEYKRKKKKYLLPVTIDVVHTVTLDSNAIDFNTEDTTQAAEEPIKCWIPYPREIPDQQYNVKRMTSEPHIHMISGNDNSQRTIYLQKLAVPDKPTEFLVQYEFTTKAVYNNIDPKKIKSLPDTSKYLKFTEEHPPHIVFNRAVEELSELIVGNETNPYEIAKKIFIWIDKNITWVKMREYSTIRSLGLYPFYYKQGDAGVKTFFFMTLARYNKIPTRLVSGVQFQPPLSSIHDWCEIYLDPYGWVPVDVTYGIQDFPDETRKYFYLGNIDSYRLIFNNDYGTDFNPKKEFCRSDIIDNQRGELETMDENIYFDKWNWNIDFKIVSSYR